MKKSYYQFFKSKPTKLDAVNVALMAAKVFGLTVSQLCRDYNLRRGTLSAIAKGKVSVRNRKYMLDKLILALNDCRLRSISKGRFDEALQIEKALTDVCLITANIAPDYEMITYRQ